MNSKLTKDFKRVNTIALDLAAQVCVMPVCVRVEEGRNVSVGSHG